MAGRARRHTDPTATLYIVLSVFPLLLAVTGLVHAAGAAQDVYARAWRIEVRTLSDQARFTVCFFVLSGLLCL